MNALRPHHRLLSGLALASLLLLGGLACHGRPPPAPKSTPATFAEWKAPQPGPTEAVVTQVASQVISRMHYAQLPLDEQVSAKIFAAYFDHLDHDRSYFLASDIVEFSPYREQLGDLLLRGQCGFAFRVYERFMQRAHERVEFVNHFLTQKPDFSADESVKLDRSKEPWCKNAGELDEVWRKRLKNQLIIFQVMEQVQAKQEAEDKKKPKLAKDTAGTQEPGSKITPKSPKERVRLFYDRLLGGLLENDKQDVLELFLNAMTQTYDPHSDYMAPESQEEFDMAMKLSLKGIGAVLQSEEGYVKVSEVMPGGPAGRDGRLHNSDWIIAVGQETGELVDVVNLPLRKVVRMIRGEKGTTVRLAVISAGKSLSGVPAVIQIVRDEVKLTEQEAKSELRTVPDRVRATGAPFKISVINLPAFYEDFAGRLKDPANYKSCSRDMLRLLEKAGADGADGIILDLRFDGGGSLEEAVKITGMFVPPGPVVQVRNTNREVKVLRSLETPVCDKPLVVLVNRLSASASEIVAAALQDYHRAVIIGDASTHGKGTVQTMLNLADAIRRTPFSAMGNPGSLKFTIAKFYRINGGSTQLKGVIPDIIFPSFTDHLELGETKLPSALPWDEINNLQATPSLDVTPYLPKLKSLSQNRIAKDVEFQAMTETIRKFGELRSIKELPLKLTKREKLQEEEEAFAKKIEAMLTMARPYKNNKKEDAPPAKDLVLAEAVNVIGDLISLCRNEGPQVATAETAAKLTTAQP